MSAPLSIRWRDAVMDDAELSWRAKAAAMPLVRHADLDGKNCYPGATTSAAEMGVSVRTIKSGWDELKSAGWLDVLPLPEGRRRTQGALKVMRFPASRHGARHAPSQRHGARQVLEPVHDVHPTYPGNQESSDSGESSDGLGSCEHCAADLLHYNAGTEDAFIACSRCHRIVRPE
jgi:hypothetical protein